MKILLSAIVVLLLVIAALLSHRFLFRLFPEPGPLVLRGSNALETARLTKDNLHKFVTDENFKDMGFHSIQEARAATLGDPISWIRMGCDFIQKWKPEYGGALKPFAFSKQTVYPLLAKDDRGISHARSTLTLDSLTDTFSGGKKPWSTQGIGRSRMAVLIDSILFVTAKNAGKPISEYTIVEFPALNRVYLSYSSQGSVYLKPLAGVILFVGRVRRNRGNL